MSALKLPPLPESTIDDIAEEQWPNDEWIDILYLMFARKVEKASRIAVLEAVAEWVRDLPADRCIDPIWIEQQLRAAAKEQGK
jgi:hypothetical protein